ncbi:MAG: triose-phosphate isomerase [Elusimicrobia bacterium]|nr:triose-phosphate isomerase [Elusimicrobiota bacterium]
MSSPLRKPFIAGNWKMHLTLAESLALAKEVAAGCAEGGPDVALCVPFTAVAAVAEALKGRPILVGGQDLHWEPQGAFTGEVAGRQLADAGCRVAIIGHSERRRCFGETDETVNKKIKAALGADLIPIVCVGETLDEREQQKTYRVLETQIRGAFMNFAPDELARVIIAYEPVWAIGTGKTAAPAQAQDAHTFIRKYVARSLQEKLAAGMRILYGGSVKADNVDALMAEPDLDGALVGGESLKAANFLRIIRFKAAAPGIGQAR